jgi:cupin fold WbuC family metalloprotein
MRFAESGSPGMRFGRLAAKESLMTIADQSNPFPQALTAPTEPVAIVTCSMIDHAITMSRESPRKRIIQPLHRSGLDVLQRMLNVLQPGSYIQPHRHLNPPKAESIVVLQGGIGFIEFDEAGSMRHAYLISREEGVLGIDIEPGVFHTFFAIAPDTVLFEVKPGPYERSNDKDFALWAPPEGSPSAREYLATLQAHWSQRRSHASTP